MCKNNRDYDFTVPNTTNFVIFEYGKPDPFKTGSLADSFVVMTRPRWFSHRTTSLNMKNKVCLSNPLVGDDSWLDEESTERRKNIGWYGTMMN